MPYEHLDDPLSDGEYEASNADTKYNDELRNVDVIPDKADSKPGDVDV